MQVQYSELQSFCHNLRLAVYDRQLEVHKKRKLIFFFDSDFVYAALLGFRQRNQRGHHRTDLKSKLAGSLFFQGYLGKARLLQAHLYEIDLSLRTKDEFVGEVAENDFISTLRSYLESADVLNHLSNLLQELENRGGKSIGEVLSESSSLDVPTFVALEQASGDWRQRLRTIGQNLDFNARKDVARDLAKHPDLAVFRTEIEGVRKKRGDGMFWKNTLKDAFALAELRSLIEDFDQDSDKGKPLVRFYTDTDVLHETWKNNPAVRDKLTYHSLGPDRDANFVVRDAEYFHLRAYFPSLRMEGLTRARASNDREDRDELSELSVISERLRGVDEPISLEATGAFEVSGRTLLEHIGELKEKTFFRRIWLQFEIPESLTGLFAELRVVEKALRDVQFSPQFQEELGDYIKRARQELSASAGDFAALFDLFTNLRARQQDLLRALGDRRKNVEIRNPVRDLGLVRWGISLSDEDSAHFQELVSAVLGTGDDPERSEDALLDLAGSIRDVRGDFKQTVLLASILWFLGDYDLASALILQNLKIRPDDGHEMRVALELMSAASRLRGRDVLTSGARKQLLDRMGSIIETQGQEGRKFSVGHAFLYFHAARGEEWVFGDREPDDQETQWAEKSLEIVEPLLGEMDVLDPLLGAFALNHYVYVSLALKRESEDLMNRLAQLGALESQRGVWNYRFVDTTSLPSYRTYVAALKRAKSSGSLEDIEALYKSIRDAVASETERYHQCGDFGDPEISVHLGKWKRLEADALTQKVANPKSFSPPSKSTRGEMPRGEIRDPQ